MFQRIGIGIAATWLAACTGTIDGGMGEAVDGFGAPGRGPGASEGDGSGEGGGAPSDGAGVPDATADPDAIAANCIGAPPVGPAPLRRMTPQEYRNTVRDLFPGVDLPELSLPSDYGGSGFDNNADAQAVSPLHIEQFDIAGARIAERAVEQLDAWAPCTPAGGEEACVAEVALTLGRQAYRRPLEADETTEFETFVQENLPEFGATTTLRMFLHGVLASPSFLYRPELGQDADAAGDADARWLTGHELASRLSYFLWRTMPDAELSEAAESGALETETGLRAQVERMLDDPRAHETVSDFHRQWMDLSRLESLNVDETRFPGIQDMRQDFQASALRFLDHHFWEGDVFSLFTSNDTFLNDRLAGFLDLPLPGSDALVPVPLDPGERAGILTQPGVLASTSHGLTHSPIMRGVTILNNVLCNELPAPPPDITPAIPDPEPGQPNTTRARVEQSHGTSECAGCHDLIDPIGFTFENYDAIGRYQLTENGEPVDSTGVVVRSGDVDGTYANGVELSAQFAVSQRVRQCIATQWFRYALGRTETAADHCQLQHLGQELIAMGDMRALLVALAMSPAFRQLPRDAT